MGERLLNIEQLQDEHCDYTRDTDKRFRVLRNVGEAARYFPIDEPVLCYGSGDGFEVEVWQLLGFDVIGCEISQKKRNMARLHGVLSEKDIDNPFMKRNVYCAHTIEHVKDRDAILFALWDVCISTICLIFPIEPNGSHNPSHLSPVRSLDDLSLPGRAVLKAERWNDEREGILICKKMGAKGY